MEIVFSDNAVEDIAYWKSSGNVKVQKRIEKLLISIQQTPFEGIGKPEGLKYSWLGYWSRRITDEHRIIYKADSEKITVVQLRDHY